MTASTPPAETFYWFDYETFGIDPALDRPSQFAGLRTTVDLEPIGEPLVIYNRLTDDYLPDPGACRVTGIGPKVVQSKGLNEARFIALISEQLGEPGTCHVGYNSIRFDDEFTRFTRYRNFYDPYEHEWKNRNSRWDMLDIVRLTRALRPDGINWPQRLDEEGQYHPTNRLEDLTRENNIEHSQAHDALSDVRATLAMARMIRDKQPKLFDFVNRNKSKQSCRELLDLRKREPVIHISGKIPARFHHLAIVTPLEQHPGNNNGVITYNLHYSAEELLALATQGDQGVEKIGTRIFSSNSTLQESGLKRLPLKTIHLNRTPVLVPLSVLRDEDAERLGIDVEACLKNHRELMNLSKHDAQQLQTAVAKAFQGRSFATPISDDASLYSSAFPSDRDRGLFEKIRQSQPQQLADFHLKEFDDPRVNGVDDQSDENTFASGTQHDLRAPGRLFSYRARNFPETLDKSEKQRWLEYCRRHLLNDGSEQHKATFPRTLESFRAELDDESWLTTESHATGGSNSGQETLRQELLEYADDLEKRLLNNSQASG